MLSRSFGFVESGPQLVDRGNCTLFSVQFKDLNRHHNGHKLSMIDRGRRQLQPNHKPGCLRCLTIASIPKRVNITVQSAPVRGNQEECWLAGPRAWYWRHGGRFG
eukprot:6451695-Amphidinium_carterae.1